MSATSGNTEAAKQRRYRGRMPEERRAQRRQKLLDAGLELFSSNGYANTSVERICTTSGVTGRHFYEEFPSREALLMAVFDEIIVGAYGLVTERVEAAPRDLRARLQAGVGAYMHFLLDDPRHARIVTAEIVGVSVDLEEHRRAAVQAFAGYIRNEAMELITEGTVLHGTDLTILALVAGIHELTAAWIDLDRPTSIDELIAEGVRMVVAVALFDG